MILTKRYLLALFVMLSVRTARAQSVNVDLVRLNPSTLPASCNTGDLRFSGALTVLEVCKSNTWVQIADASGTFINPMTSDGDMIYQAAGIPARLPIGATGTVLQGSNSLVPTYSSIMTLGQALGTTGRIRLLGNSSGTVSLTVQDDSGTYNFNLPTVSGTAGQVLQSQGGAGNVMQWIDMSYSSLTAGVVPINRGGTNNTALAVTAGGPLYTDGTRIQNAGAGTAGQVLQSNGAGAPVWTTLSTSSAPVNGLLNAGFDYWMDGSSVNVTATGGGTPATVVRYGPELWYTVNALGAGTTEAIVQMTQTTGSLTTSLFGVSVKVTRAPVGTGIGSFVSLSQPLSNKASLAYYNQTASFSVQVKAQGNIDRVACGMLYATSEGRPTLGLGTDVTVAVTTAAFVTCSVTQNIGTNPTLAGNVGVRIYAPHASTGNAYDLNNGFVAEQAILVVGQPATTWARQNANPASEIAGMRYFHEKSYEPDVAPGTIDSIGSIIEIMPSTSHVYYVKYAAEKVIRPTVTIYSDITGAASNCRDTSASADIACSASTVRLGKLSFTITGSSTANHINTFHFDADARFY